MASKDKIDETQQRSVVADFETAITHAGYGKYNYLLALLALPGLFSSSLCNTSISYVLPAAHCDLKLTNFDKGTLNAISYAGLISGAFLWGFLSDNIGRRKILMIAFLMDGLLGLISSLAQTIWFLQLFRFWVGFANAGPYSILLTYLSEFHASRYRSRIIIYVMSYASLCLVVTPGIAWLMLPQSWSWDLFGGSFKYHSWNVFLAVCSLPSIITGFCLYFFKESPKFLMSRGQYEEAMKVFKYVYECNTGHHPDKFPINELTDEMASSISPSSSGVSGKNILKFLEAGLIQTKPLITKIHLPVAVLIFCLKFCTHFGINTLRLWMPQIFSAMQEYLNASDGSAQNIPLCEMIARNSSIQNMNNGSFPGDSECVVYVSDPWIYINSMIVGAVGGTCILATGILINSVGNRILLSSCFFLAGMCGLSIYWSYNSSLTTSLLAMYQGFLEVSITLLVTVTVQLFPTTLRTLSLSLSMMFGRLGSLIGNLIFPIFFEVSCEAPFFLTSSVVLSCCIFVWLLPDIKKHSFR